MAPKKLQVGIVGLGRMARRHATNFLQRTFRADVVAAWAFDDHEAEWGYQQLQPHGATVYTDYDRFLQHAGLDAVVIATVVGAHSDQALKAIEMDKHVLCEKPLSISADIVSYQYRKKSWHLCTKLTNLEIITTVSICCRRCSQEATPQGPLRLFPPL